jgi:hypothetical protein
MLPNINWGGGGGYKGRQQGGPISLFLFFQNKEVG